MSYVVMRSLLNREQLRRRPETPQTIAELDLLLINYQPVQYIFKGTVVSDEGYRAVIFTSDALLDALVKSKEIYMDGTFSVVPRVPSFAQLYTIHIRYMDTGIAVLFALCEKRTMNVYNAIWRKLKELRPDALREVRSVMSDYERAAMTVAREIFPNSRLTGCWFHFNQAVLRRWRALGLTAAPRKILGLTMALPLAPVNMFEQGLQIIQEEADIISAEYPAVLQFTVYLRRTWLPLKDKISNFGTSIRTNNLVESFHYVIFRKLGGIHPNIWNFLHNLSDLITDQEINIARLAEGLSVKRVRVRQNTVRDKRIAEAQSLLNSGRYSLEEFLLALSNATNLPEENIDLQNIYDTDNQEMVDGNLFDAHAAASEDIRTLSQNAGLAGRGRRSRGRPPSRRGRRGRLASSSNQNQIREETDEEENRRTQELITRVESIGNGNERSEIINEGMTVTADLMPLLDDVGRTNRISPRGRGRHVRRGRNMQRAAFEDIQRLNQNAGQVGRGRRSRGRPPSRRGRRGRLARRPHLIREETVNTDEEERTQELIAHVEPIGNERNEIINEETASIEESRRSEDDMLTRADELIARMNSILSESERNDTVINNEDERIFDIPEDDYGALGFDDEQNDLPFHPAPSGPVSASNERGACCTCRSAPATHVFVPCGHLCICSDCKQRFVDYKCPLCRKDYMHCIRVITT